MLSTLFENPEHYRIGANYKATNIVFPVEFEGHKYIIKGLRNSSISQIIQCYYSFQENLSFNYFRRDSARVGLIREIRTLDQLGGLHSPHLFLADEGLPILVREYLNGRDFRNLSSDVEIKRTLDGALDAMVEIHDNNVIIGDAHVKNTFLSNDERAYWLDFDFIGSASKAQDLFKFVYSTYTTTRDKDKVIYAAELVKRNYEDGRVKQELKEMVSRAEMGLSLWFSTRLPLDGKLCQELKSILAR